MFSAVKPRFPCLPVKLYCAAPRSIKLPRSQIRFPLVKHCPSRQFHLSYKRRPAIKMSNRDQILSGRRRTAFRAYGNPAYDPFRSNKTILWSTIGVSVAVFAAWQYAAQAGPSRMSNFGARSSEQSTPQMVKSFLMQNFLLSPKDLSNGKIWTLLTSAVSHQDLNHLLGNMFSLHAFGSVLIYAVASPIHVATLFAGSALAGSIAFLLQQSSSPYARQVYALGASGMVMGVGAAAAMLRPKTQLLLMGIVPVRLWALLPGYIAWDSFFLNSPQSRTGHAAHLGGATFGALFYALFLRRFGGIF